VVGSLYPSDIPWPENVAIRWHLDPREHPAFYSANRLTLSLTRKAMRQWGFTPSGRLFEAAACGTPVLSDRFPGVEEFFRPGEEILLAQDADDVNASLALSDTEIRRIGTAAHERTLTEHTGAQRATDLLEACRAC
jgi:spore maturation protein CgeB